MSENPYQTPESMPELVYSQEEVVDYSLLRSASLWGLLCVLLLGAEVIFSLLTTLGVFRQYYIIFNTEIIGVMMGLWGGFIITFCIWTCKSMTNAWVAGVPTPTITPSNAVYYYFTPILWFWKPYVAMRQIWDNLFGVDSSKSSLRSWWFLWLGFWMFVLFAVIATKEKHDSASFYMGCARYCKILAGILLIIVISKITMGHNEKIAGTRN